MGQMSSATVECLLAVKNEKMEEGNQKNLDSINHLITNSFLHQTIDCKLYICHYIFCSYALTKNILFLEFALSMLEETLKVAYLNKKRKKSEFYRVVDYCVSISIIFRIDLEIDELITEDCDTQQSMKIYRMLEENLLQADDRLGGQSLDQKKLPLQVVLQVRNGKINKKNYLTYIQSFYEKYYASKSKVYLLCIILISYLLANNNVLKKAMGQLNHRRSRSINDRIISIIKARNENNFIVIDTDIVSVIFNINSKLNVDLGIIYYFLIHEKAKRCFN